MDFVHQMDILNTILNILLPPLTLIFFFIFYPIYLIIKLLIYIFKYFQFENVAGKVVLITGAASGIGENIAYEYAKKGANLVLVDRREDRLNLVAEISNLLGSGEVITIHGDVSNINDCKKFIDQTIHHFGKHHLVNNAGIFQTVLFEDFTHIQDAKPIMDINFWGSTYITHFAIPQLRKTKGKIIVITSASAHLALPLSSIYSASKTALLRFFETLRVELNPDIKITIVIPGFIATNMTTPYFKNKYGSDFKLSEPVHKCSKSIFKGITRGDAYIEEPLWIKWAIFFKNLCPEIVEFIMKYLFLD